MAEIVVEGLDGASRGTALMNILASEDIQPGSDVSYQACKEIYLFHPLGAKLVEKPIEIAQSQSREITVPGSPEDRLVEAFEKTWKRIRADQNIFNIAALARTYGISSIGLQEEGVDPSEPIDFKKLGKRGQVGFSSFDPLNTAGSLVLDQNPISPDFQHVKEIAVGGKTFHKSRTCVMMNERPIYISYTTSAFGFVGRSVYQRALFPLKSYLNTMLVDDMIATKAGVIVAKIKPAGSIVNRAQQAFTGIKRAVVREARTYGIISVGPEDTIESLDLQNIDGAASMARKNIMENIAAAAGQPALMVTQETIAQGLAEGTEDAKEIVRYINRFREWLCPLYDFFDRICMHMAWTEEFFAALKVDFPEYEGRDYDAVFAEWSNAFTAVWPSLLIEPESERAKADKVRLEGFASMFEMLSPALDPENKAVLIEFIQDNINQLETIFVDKLDLDIEALKNYVPPSPITSEEADQDDELPNKPKTLAA